MTQKIPLEPLTAAAFQPFGSVIEAAGDPSFLINRERCERYHNLARPEVSGGKDRTILSVARSQPVALPMTLDLMERHPLGSQAFIPMQGTRFIVTVAEDAGGKPGKPRAFLTNGNQGIQYRTNCWHGVLAPLEGPSDFLIVDRMGDGVNLEEYDLPTPYVITLGA